MAPAPHKRKRPDRQYPYDDGRPSPHRPDFLGMAHQDPRQDLRGGGRGDHRRQRGDRGHFNQPGDRNSWQPHSNGGRHGTSSNQTPTVRSPVAQHGATPSAPAAGPMSVRHVAPRAIPTSREPSPPLKELVYEYDIFTDENVTTWSAGGKEKIKGLILPINNEIDESAWLQELVTSAIHRRVDATEAGAFFSEISSARKEAEAALNTEETFVDAVSLLPPADWKRIAFSKLVIASGIPADTWRMILESDCVEALGMSRERFARKKAVKITNYLYRQSNYNLLREESEGYAKLITEYFNVAQNASAVDSPPTIALDAFERVKALVGSFDLDVGRVLDITLDVFANLLVRNFRFFVKFVRVSSWWPDRECPSVLKIRGQGFDTLPEWALPSSIDWGVGQEEADRRTRLRPLTEARDTAFWQQVAQVGMQAFFDIGTARIMNFEDSSVQQYLHAEIEPSKDDMDAKGVEKNKIKRLRSNEMRKWMLSTQVLPPQGNPEAANLLGFKLAFYTSPARDAEDIMPENLIYLSALLIKVGFISLRDLYPHLYPADEKMQEAKVQLEKEQEEREYANRPGGGPNKLAMSGALPDDTAPAIPAVRNLRDTPASKANSPKPETETKAASDETVLPEPPNQKILLLKGLLAIGALPEALFILGKFPWLADLLHDLPTYIHRILHHMLSGIYENMRPLQDRDELTRPASTLGDPTGLPKGSLNQIQSNTRPAKRWAQLDRPDEGEGIAYKFYWDDWNDNIPICRTVDEVFLMCSTLLNLSGVKIGQDPSLLLKLARIGKHSLSQDRSPENEGRWIDLLRRLIVPALSLTAKNPGTSSEVFELLRLFPTSTRYSIYAEWHFGPTARLPDIKRAFDRTRAEAKDVLKRISKTNVRPMGKALAKVAYASPGIVLQTAINQMEAYENMIEVFVECSRYFTYLGYDVLTWCLLNALGGAGRSGIQSDGMLTSSWLRALSTFAGAIYKRYALCDPAPILHYVASELRNGESTNLELLEQIIVAMVGVKSDMAFNDAQILAMAGGEVLQAQTLQRMADERHKNEKSSKRLLRILIDTGLAGQILIAISQERQMYSSRESAKDAPLKVLGNNIDKIHQVLVQYLEAFRSGATIEQFRGAVPGPIELMTDFGLDVEIAFMVGRAGVARDVAAIDAARKAELQEKVRSANTVEEAPSIDVAMTDPTTATAGEVALAQDRSDAMVVEAVNGVDDPSGDSHEAKASKGQTVSVWHPALAAFIDELPGVLGESVASSISIPFYATFWTLGLQDILVNNTAYEQELAYQTSLVNQIKHDRSDPSAAGAKKREADTRAINELKTRLGKEMRGQIGAYTQVRNRLSKEKDHWFGAFLNKVQTLHTSLLQQCFLPRILLSPLDAQYTFTMIKFLHNNATPGFRTMHLYDMFFKKGQIASLIFSVTAREAENLGRFMSEVFKEMSFWHADKTVYEKNAYGAKRQLPGFARKLDENYAPLSFLSFEEFRHILYKWHLSLFNDIKVCLGLQEYMHIRNAIIILRAMPPSFPVVNFMVSELVGKVTELGQNEKRGDLKLAATSLLGGLKPQEKLTWLPQEFKFEGGKPGIGKATPASTPANQASPVVKTAILNASASEFNPTAQASGNNEAEDGEIDDDKKDPQTNDKTDAIKLDSKPLGVPERSIERGRISAAGSPAPRSSTPKPAVDLLANRMQPRSSSRDDRVKPSDRPPRQGRDPQGDNYGRLDRPDDLRRAPERFQQDNRMLAGQDVPVHDGRLARDDRSTAPRDSVGAASKANTQSFRSDAADPSKAQDRTLQSPNVPRVLNQSQEDASGPQLQSTTMINSARRALIEGSQKQDGPSAPRHDAARGSGKTARNLSPRRDATGPTQKHTDEALARGSTQHSDRQLDLAPIGPRHDRLPVEEPRSSGREFAGSRDGGRFPQEDAGDRNGPRQHSKQHDPTYGRLDRPEAPSGPRGGPPTGPASKQQTTSPTMPQGFDPQRREPRGDQVPSAPPRDASQDQLAGVHPSRRAGLSVDAGVAHSQAPTGSNAPSSAPRTPASGPATAGPRSDRRFQGLNDALQGSAGQGTPVKGHAVRANGAMPPPNPASHAGSAPVLKPAAAPQTDARTGPPSRQASVRSASSRGNDGPSFNGTHSGPRPDYDQPPDYIHRPAAAGRHDPRNGPPGREPSRDPPREDPLRRSDYRGGPQEATRPTHSRESNYREGYNDRRDADARGAYRDDAFGRGPPPSARPGPVYPSDARGHSGFDPYAGPPRSDPRAPHQFDGPPRGDYQYGQDARGGYPPSRPDDRGPGGPAGRGEPPRDVRKRRGDEMGLDPAKRRRDGP